MAGRDTLSSLGHVARSSTVRGVAAALIAAAGATWAWAGQRATLEDIAAAVRTHDHGHPKELPLDEHGRRLPSHHDMTRAIEDLQGELAARQVESDACREWVTDAFRLIVRRMAAEGETRRTRKADAANAAQDDYDALIDEGKAPPEAARDALRSPPPR